MAELAVVGMGDPHSPACWSGTSARLIGVLERRGMQCRGIDAHTVAPAMRYVYGAGYQLQRLPFPRSVQNVRDEITILRSEARNDFNLTRGPRETRARNVIARMRALGITQALHMVQHAVPTWSELGLEHYLVFDSTFHIECEYQPLATRYPTRIRRHIEAVEREMFAQVKHFFPLGEYVKADLVQHYGIDPRRITPVGTGLGRIRPYFGPKDYESGHILCVARARVREKGVFLLVNAFQLAHARNPSLRLVIAGHPRLREWIGDVEGVAIHGFLEPQELQRLFETAALFCMPALHEPWGLVYLEAMACRAPVLALRRNALAEITADGQCGVLVEEALPERLAAAMLQAFRNPAKLQVMGMAAQERALHHYGWDRAGGLIADVIGGA